MFFPVVASNVSIINHTLVALIGKNRPSTYQFSIYSHRCDGVRAFHAYRHALFKNISEFELLTTLSQGNLSILTVINGSELLVISQSSLKIHALHVYYGFLLTFVLLCGPLPHSGPI